MTITDLQIKNLKSREQKYEITDGQGLVVHIQPTGKKTWHYRYIFAGNPRIMKIGDYPGVSLAEARKRHADAMLTLQQGIDPGKKAQEEKKRRFSAPTFADLFDEFKEIELSKSATSKERGRLVEKDVLPEWRKTKIHEIRRRDAVLILDKVRERAPVTANRLQGVLVRMFNFAAERGLIDFSPLTGMRRGKEKSRERVLTDKEIKTFWECLDVARTDIDVFHIVKFALKAILLTGQRPGEICAMRKDQINDNLWIIPREERKNEEANEIPVCPMFAEVIDMAAPYNQDSIYIFPSPQLTQNDKKRRDEHITVGALANALRRHREEMKVNDPFTPHDLRRTLRTRLAEIGVSDIVAERVLGHKLQGVLGIYNRHSYIEEKRQALAAWEKRLRELIEHTEPTTNVLNFPARGGKK